MSKRLSTLCFLAISLGLQPCHAADLPKPAAPAAANPAKPTAASRKPNILFILADDQAWSGLAVAMDPKVPGSRDNIIETPNLAKLAANGMCFAQAYAPAPVCSPTRISIQTGKTPASQHWTKAAPSVGNGPSFKLLEANCVKDMDTKQTTLGELLKSAGYTTAHYGKWHIEGGGPEANGYDESDGNTGNRDADKFVAPDPCAVFSTATRAAAFMKKAQQTGKPFYIQISSYALHDSGNALSETIAKYKAKMPGANDKEAPRAAIMENLDSSIGQLLKSVDDMGLASNTYVIYMADNGMGAHRGALSGGKGDLKEAGIRVPFIIRGPGIAAGGLSRTMICGEDLLPTFCHLVGVAEADLPKGLAGGDFSAVLTNPDAPVKRSQPGMTFHFPHYQGGTPSSALVINNWKLIYYYEDQRAELYNLSNELAEKNDLAASDAARAADMKSQLLTRLKDQGAWLPTPNPAYDPKAPKEDTKGGGKEKGGGRRGDKRGGGQP